MAGNNDISVKIGSDTSDLSKGLKQSESQLKQFGNTVNQAVNNPLNTLKGIVAKNPWTALALGITAAGMAAFKFTKKIATSIEAANKQAKALNMTTSSYKRLQAAARITGTDFNNVTKVLSAVDKAIENASSGSEEAVKNFHALRLSFSELQKMNPEQKLAVLSKRMQAFNGKGMNATFEKLLGREGTKSLKELVEVDFSKVAAAGKMLGIDIDKKAAASASQFINSMELTSDKLLSLVSSLTLFEKTLDFVNKRNEGIKNSIGNKMWTKAPDEIKAQYYTMRDLFELDQERRKLSALPQKGKNKITEAQKKRLNELNGILKNYENEVDFNYDRTTLTPEDREYLSPIFHPNLWKDHKKRSSGQVTPEGAYKEIMEVLANDASRGNVTENEIHKYAVKKSQERYWSGEAPFGFPEFANHDLIDWITPFKDIPVFDEKEYDKKAALDALSTDPEYYAKFMIAKEFNKARDKMNEDLKSLDAAEFTKKYGITTEIASNYLKVGGKELAETLKPHTNIGHIVEKYSEMQARKAAESTSGNPDPIKSDPVYKAVEKTVETLDKNVTPPAASIIAGNIANSRNEIIASAERAQLNLKMLHVEKDYLANGGFQEQIRKIAETMKPLGEEAVNNAQQAFINTHNPSAMANKIKDAEKLAEELTDKAKGIKPTATFGKGSVSVPFTSSKMEYFVYDVFKKEGDKMTKLFSTNNLNHISKVTPIYDNGKVVAWTTSEGNIVKLRNIATTVNPNAAVPTHFFGPITNIPPEVVKQGTYDIDEVRMMRTFELSPELRFLVKNKDRFSDASKPQNWVFDKALPLPSEEEVKKKDAEAMKSSAIEQAKAAYEAYQKQTAKAEELPLTYKGIVEKIREIEKKTGAQIKDDELLNALLQKRLEIMKNLSKAADEEHKAEMKSIDLEMSQIRMQNARSDKDRQREFMKQEAAALNESGVKKLLGRDLTANELLSEDNKFSKQLKADKKRLAELEDDKRLLESQIQSEQTDEAKAAGKKRNAERAASIKDAITSFLFYTDNEFTKKFTINKDRTSATGFSKEDEQAYLASVKAKIEEDKKNNVEYSEAERSLEAYQRWQEAQASSTYEDGLKALKDELDEVTKKTAEQKHIVEDGNMQEKKIAELRKQKLEKWKKMQEKADLEGRYETYAANQQTIDSADASFASRIEAALNNAFSAAKSAGRSDKEASQEAIAAAMREQVEQMKQAKPSYNNAVYTNELAQRGGFSSSVVGASATDYERQMLNYAKAISMGTQQLVQYNAKHYKELYG